MKFVNWIKNQFLEDQHRFVLWIPVLFGLGVVFYFYSSPHFLIFPLILFFISIILSYFLRQELSFLFAAIIAWFLAGYLWVWFYASKVNYTPTVKHKIYALAVGRVDDVTYFYNPISRKNIPKVTIGDLRLYKVENKNRNSGQWEVRSGSGQLAVGSGQLKVKKKNEIESKKYHRKKKKEKGLGKDMNVTEGVANPFRADVEGKVDSRQSSVVSQKVKKYHRKKRKEKEVNEKLGKDMNVTEGVANPFRADIANTEANIENSDNEKLEKKPRKHRRKSKKKQQKENRQMFEAFGSGGEVAWGEVLKNEKEKAREKNKKAKEKKIKKPKILKNKNDNKTVIRSYLNLAGYQEINRSLNRISSDENEWEGNKYKNPPRKVTINVNTKFDEFRVGDLIKVIVVLEPLKHASKIDNYDFAFDTYFKGIGGNGFAASKLEVVKPAQHFEFNNDIKFLRQKIARKIFDSMVYDKDNFSLSYGDSNKVGRNSCCVLQNNNIQKSSRISGYDQATIAIALLVGWQNYIPKDLMQNIRNSGLAHLISISGLHLTLACGIFFFSIRFLLSLNVFLTLNFNIKKIAAIISIGAGMFYLLLAGMPIPAIRSFIMVSLIFAAIIIDRMPNPHRSIALAALIILIISPEVIFSVSFQFSFAAILALITLYDVTKKTAEEKEEKPFYLKIIFYLLGIIFSSLAVEAMMIPLSIYHFNNFIGYSVLANLVAIPLTSFITMPLGFLSFFLMPLGLEKWALIPMQYSIDGVIYIANLVASLPYSSIKVSMISSIAFGFMVAGGLWFCLWHGRWRFLAILPITVGIILAIKTPLPNLLIDREHKLFAIWNDKKSGLIFSKKTNNLNYTEKRWMQRMGEVEYKYNPEFCGASNCATEIKGEKILFLTARNKIDFICQSDADYIVNLASKYKLPECVKDKELISDINYFDF